jgi:hypothetical protein
MGQLAPPRSPLGLFQAADWLPHLVRERHLQRRKRSSKSPIGGRATTLCRNAGRQRLGSPPCRFTGRPRCARPDHSRVAAVGALAACHDQSRVDYRRVATSWAELVVNRLCMNDDTECRRRAAALYICRHVATPSRPFPFAGDRPRAWRLAKGVTSSATGDVNLA